MWGTQGRVAVGGKECRLLLATPLLFFALMSAPTSANPSKTKVFLRRLLSTLLLWAVILVAMFSGNHFVSDGAFILLVVFLALTGLVEFYGLAEKRGLHSFKISGVIGGLLLMLGTFFHLTTNHLGINDSPARANDFETGFIILFVLGLCVRQFVSKSNTAGLVAISTTLFGLMYVPWLFNFIQKINFFPFAPGSPAEAGKFFLL